MECFDIHTHILSGLTPGNEGSPETFGLISLSPQEYRSWKGPFCSVGIHPWNISSSSECDLNFLSELAGDECVKAIGESGIDTLHSTASLETQIRLFSEQVKISESSGKPMVLHVVRHFDEILRLRKTMCPLQSWLLHGFRGGPIQATQLISHGIMVSLGLNAQRDTIAQIPLETLFVETDGKCAVSDVINRIAEIRKTSVEEIADVANHNANLFLKLGLHT